MIIINKIFLVVILVNYLSFSQDLGKQELGNWEIYGNMPIPIYNGAAVSNDSIILVLGGISDSINQLTDLIQQFNPNPVSEWSVIGHLTYSREGFSAGKYEDDFYLFGGLENNMVGIYSPGHIERIDFNNPGVSQVTDSVDNFIRLYSAGELIDGKCFIIGGLDIFRPLPAIIPYIIEYDLNDRTTYEFQWPFGLNLFPTLQMTSAIVDTIFIFGGTYNTILNDIFLYDIQSKTLQTLALRLLEPRADGIAIRIPNTNKILIMGGFSELFNSLRTTEIFEVTDSGYTIKSGPMLNFGRRGLMSAILGNYIYIFGGLDENFMSASIIERIKLSDLVDVNETNPSLPNSFILYQNYPNPFNPETTIKFSLPISSEVSIDIFSSLGELIINLVNGYYSSGTHSVLWNGKNEFGQSVPSGVYFYKMSSKSFNETRKMVLLR